MADIQQLPEGYYFKSDMTEQVCPAGFKGWLPPVTGTVERIVERTPGRLIPATEGSTGG